MFDDKKQSKDSLFSFEQSASVPGQADQPQEGALFSSKPDKKKDPGLAYGYEKKLFRSKNEVSAYTDQMDARYAMDKRARALLILSVATILLILLFIVLPTGWLTKNGIEIGLAGFVDTFQSNLAAIGNLASGVEDGNGMRYLIWQMLAVALVGGALALNGAVYQGALKNALASPSTLGVMSGGTLGAIIYSLVWIPSTTENQELAENGYLIYKASDLISYYDSLSTFDYIMNVQLRAICSVIGCFVVVMLVLAIAYIAGKGKVSKSALVIAGQVFAAVIGSVVSVVRTWITYYGSDEQLEAIKTAAGGSINYIMGPLDFSLIAIPVLIGFVIVMCLRSRLNLLAFNDEEARSMGLSVNRTRIAVIAVCTIMTAVVVSFCGNVGFVGFLVPHIARKIVGPDLRYHIPASCLIGAIYLLVSNYVMSIGNLFSQSLGTFTSMIGVIFFIVTLVMQRRNNNADWI